MQNFIYLYAPSYATALSLHLGARATTAVMSEVPIGWTVSQRAGVLIPDLLVAFDIDPELIKAQNGYAIESHGKPPDFVLEVASRSTGREDDNRKREGYARYGVPEYWRFDPSGGRFHGARLAGDRLVDGEYRPIPVDDVDPDTCQGHSGVLGLDHVLGRWRPALVRPGCGVLPAHARRRGRRPHRRRGAGEPVGSRDRNAAVPVVPPTKTASHHPRRRGGFESPFLGVSSAHQGRGLSCGCNGGSQRFPHLWSHQV